MAKKKRKNSNWQVPKDAKKFFDRHYNDSFKARHKALTILIVIVDLIVVLVPIEGFIAALGFIVPEDGNTLLIATFAIIGIIGSAAVSLGVANVWMAALDQYLGHAVTVISIGAGLAVCALSLWMISLA